MSAVARSKGTVKWFDEWRGFGFITPDNGGDELFVHKSSIKVGGSLDDGEAVEFVVAVGEDGRIKAADVVGLGRVFRGSCYNCGEKGHMEKDCDKSSVGGGGRFRRGGGGGSCYNCGQPGHLARECYNSSSCGSCYTCGEAGHHARDCYNTNVDGCAICGRKSHFAIQCLSEPKSPPRSKEDGGTNGGSRQSNGDRASPGGGPYLTMADYPPLGNGGDDSSVIRSQLKVKALVSSIDGSGSETQIRAGQSGQLLNGSVHLVQDGGGKSQRQGTAPLATGRTGQQSSGKGEVDYSDEVTSDEDEGSFSSAGSSSSGSEIQADGDTELDLGSSPGGGTCLAKADSPLLGNGGTDSSVVRSQLMVKALVSNVEALGSATQIGAGRGGWLLDGRGQLVQDGGVESQRQGTTVPPLPTVPTKQQFSGNGAMNSSNEVTSDEATGSSSFAGSSSSGAEVQADGDMELDLDRAATSTDNPNLPEGLNDGTAFSVVRSQLIMKGLVSDFEGSGSATQIDARQGGWLLDGSDQLVQDGGVKSQLLETILLLTEQQSSGKGVMNSSDEVTSDEAAESSSSAGSSSLGSKIPADGGTELDLDRAATSTGNTDPPDDLNDVDMTVPMLTFDKVGVIDLFGNGKTSPSSSRSPILANAPPKSGETAYSGDVPRSQDSYVAFQKTVNINDYSLDGKSVTMDDDIVDQNIGKFDNSLVGKLLGHNLSFSYLNAELHQKWLSFGEFRLILMLDDCFICIFNSLTARNSVLLGGPWFINEYVIALNTWSPDFNSSSMKGFSTPIWVCLPSLPPIFWDPTNLGRIASMVGEPLWMDSGTISWDRVAYARVSVKADLSKPLLPGVWVHSKYQSFFQPMEYEGLSSLCYHCGCVSHSVKTCPVRTAESRTPSTHPVNAKDSSDEVTSDEAAGSSLSTGSSSSESEIQADDDMKLDLDRTATSTVNPVLPDCLNNVDMTVPMLAFSEVGVSDLFRNGKIVPSTCLSPVLANAPPKSGETAYLGEVPRAQDSYVAFQKTVNINDYSPDGKSVTMDDDIVDQNIGKFDYALVGKLLGCSLSFSYLNAELRQKWLPFGEFRLILMLDDCFICIFNSLIARDSVLRGAPWFINEYVAGLDTWSPGFNSSSMKGFSTPIWVRLPSLPPIFWDPTNLGRIASMVGEPLWMDSGTISWDRVAYARVSVKADLSKPLLPGVWVHSKYQSFFQPMEYEGLSSLCYHCGCVSHSVKTCPVRTAESGEPSTHPVNAKDSSDEVTRDEAAGSSLSTGSSSSESEIQADDDMELDLDRTATSTVNPVLPDCLNNVDMTVPMLAFNEVGVSDLFCNGKIVPSTCPSPVLANAPPKSSEVAYSGGVPLGQDSYVAFQKTGNINDYSADGKSVIMDDDIVDQNIGKFDNALVGKLLGCSLSFSYVSAELRQKWLPFGEFRLILMLDNCFICIFNSLLARDSVLRGAPWVINEYIVGLDTWTPNFNSSFMKGFSTPIWVRLPSLPPIFWDPTNLGRIASVVGEPLWMDSGTISWDRVAYARVSVKADLSKPLLPGVWVHSKYQSFFQPMEYEGLSSVCYHCGCVSHSVKTCPVRTAKSGTPSTPPASTPPVNLPPVASINPSLPGVAVRPRDHTSAKAPSVKPDKEVHELTISNSSKGKQKVVLHPLHLWRRPQILMFIL